ncbi:MAG: sugar ABC transporter ATP-binding protein [Caldilineaceae bacterium SB0675_bin_29]|uniref:Sugar ABC transporter ATP-binding protein n=1 Tax=Caldilineaceae bacterium SB0675_bin_29 TaxID=2605266 RepID=A0A6B1FWE9_9CHLR|nr:sugar ABC transporter ATP-binding protein [Caldilineaceae bacterium SB0675_bin_29]
MSESQPLLATVKVAKSYGPVVALREVDFAVRRGEVHALLGANGAGKSTLVKILAGVHPADAGSVHVDGRAIQFHDPVDAMAVGTATVFQDPALIPDLTVRQNLQLSEIKGSAFTHWLEWFDLQALDLDALVRELPLETLRVVDLARALARDPEVLLLDEITAALTADQAERVFALLTEWREQGRAAVLITHRLADVRRICDRATILRDGRNVALFEPNAKATNGTLAGTMQDVDEHELVEAMLGSGVGELEESDEPETASQQESDARTSSQEIAFAVQGLNSGDVVRDISFELRRGEILGLVALEGQGQERLFSLLSGDRQPSDGVILVDGSQRRWRAPYDAVGDGVVLIPGDRLLTLLPNLPVRQNLVVPLFSRIRHWLHIPSDERQLAMNAIDRLSIDTRAASQVRRLSGGNQQKVAIGRWLVAGFRTLLCFDPTRGIDVQTKREIYALLRELAASGAAILLYTSELAEIKLVCDRVLIMHDGRIVDEQNAAHATEASLLTAAHGLEVPA